MTDVTTRDAFLRQMLSDRRHEMHDDVQSRIRHGRTDRAIEVGDDVEYSDAEQPVALLGCGRFLV